MGCELLLISQFFSATRSRSYFTSKLLVMVYIFLRLIDFNASTEEIGQET